MGCTAEEPSAESRAESPFSIAGPRIVLDAARLETATGRGATGKTLSGTVFVRAGVGVTVVSVRYTTDGWVTWREVDAQRFGPQADSWERWDFADQVGDKAVVELAAYYTDFSKNTYWDNNKGKDYRPVYDDIAPVCAFTYVDTRADGTFVGQVTLRNLAYEKAVKVTYDLDYGTRVTSDANFVKALSNDGEVWEIRGSLPNGPLSPAPFTHFEAECSQAGLRITSPIGSTPFPGSTGRQQ